MVTLVFVRAPEAGRVKTRLAAALGAEGALRVYRRLAEHTLREARALGGEVRVHFTPADAGTEVRAWLGDGPRYLPQSAGGLGTRMEAAFRAAFEDGADRVVIIGSDLPELSAALLRRAFDALESHAAVLGPARDGGYYLLGMRTMIDGLFDGIPWSTDEVLARTLERLGAAGIQPALLDSLSDVDEVDDLPAGWAEWARAEGAR
jgi:rSAM/selenodomain-associated transferase 1